jgi:pyruvate/2-oxoglutarate dehydrogenase complex dihydrolipoamide acyltransferase (E2) component
MRHEIRVPELGDGIVEAFVSEWLVDIGASVEVGDELVEITTDKANVVIEAELSGTVIERLAAEEQRVAVGEVLGILETTP